MYICFMTELDDEYKDSEGLKYLRWSMFDCPFEKGSGYKFMEREPVYILDTIMHMYKKSGIVLEINLGYTSPKGARYHNLSSKDPHRLGLAVRLGINGWGDRKRWMLVRGLILCDVKRIAVAKDFVYFDLDELRDTMFAIW